MQPNTTNPTSVNPNSHFHITHQERRHHNAFFFFLAFFMIQFYLCVSQTSFPSLKWCFAALDAGDSRDGGAAARMSSHSVLLLLWALCRILQIINSEGLGCAETFISPNCLGACCPWLSISSSSFFCYFHTFL